MIVGFTVTSISTDAQRQALADYVKKVCPVTDEVANNIANVGIGVNVFSRNVSTDDLENLPLGTQVIQTTPEKLMIISLLSQRLELPIGEKVYSIPPTGFIEINNSDAVGIEWALDNGYIYITPGEDGSFNWDDTKYWDDTKLWTEQ